MNWPLLLGSLVAILVLASIARMLRLGGGKLSDADQARRIAEETLTGFVAGTAFVGIDGDAAVVLGADGRVAVLRRHGARFVARALSPPLVVDCAGEVVVIDSGERLLGPFVITLAKAAEARELTQVLAAIAPNA